MTSRHRDRAIPSALMTPGGPGPLGVSVVRGDRAGGRTATCDCCGALILERTVRLRLSDPSGISGVICPDCVLQGPRGAARRMRDLLMKRMASAPVPAGGSSRRDLEAWERWMSRKIGTLSRASSFPMPARLAAARELRSTR